jgi:serine/threonine protein kinase
VHRDIKPSNIMITKNGVVKIVDFGIARMTQQTATWTNVISGTAGYMSPEQTLGHNVDQRTDLWSLGVVMAEALTGHHPFQRDSMPASHSTMVVEFIAIAPTTTSAPASVVVRAHKEGNAPVQLSGLLSSTGTNRLGNGRGI